MERGRDEIDSTSDNGEWHDLDVEVGFDRVSNVYYVVSSDIPGLNVETATFETLVEVTIDAAPDLVDGLEARTRINFRRTVALTSSDGR